MADFFDLQLFADGGAAGDGGAAADPAAPAGETAAPDAGEQRLRELGVPENVLAKHRAKRLSQPNRVEAKAEQAAAAPTEAPEAAKPSRMSWEDIKNVPEFNAKIQEIVQARLRTAKAAEERLQKLTPAFELLASRYGMDPANLDADKLVSAISDDDSFYEQKALDMGVSVDVAKRIDQSERAEARRQQEQAQTEQQRMIMQHFEGLKQQEQALKQTFPNFNLEEELQNPVFLRMTAPGVGLSVEDAYYAIHRKEIQTASMQVAAQQTAAKMANAVRSGANRPVENGAKAASQTTFDYRTATPAQREDLKRRIREAAAQGKKIYPGQW